MVAVVVAAAVDDAAADALLLAFQSLSPILRVPLKKAYQTFSSRMT